jgi:hypothetical protein
MRLIPTIYTPKAADLKFIKAEAAKLAKRNGGHGRRFSVEVGERVNTEIEGGRSKPHVNILVVTGDPDWNNTDLDDKYPADRLRGRPIPMVNGWIVCDFYIYENDPANGHGDLVCNMQARFDFLGVCALYADDNRPFWTRDRSFEGVAKTAAPVER